MRNRSARRPGGPSRSCRCDPGIPERQTHDYARHGVTCLFAALDAATGQVTDACYPRHRHQEFLRFLNNAAACPGQDLHVVCDNYSTRKHAGVTAWLAKNPRVIPHFTPAGCSWLNLVECLFPVITRQAIRRGSRAIEKYPPICRPARSISTVTLWQPND